MRPVGRRWYGYRECYWYWHGLRLGLRNLLRSGFRLGIKRTLGKILQPVNSYTRFPEYELFHQWIEAELPDRSSDRQRVRILDLGSPKLFGLLEAEVRPCHLYATDVSRADLVQYLGMAPRFRPRGGAIRFCQADGRALPFADGQFDLVYSMSVIEHVEGEGQDSWAVRELVRVLKPGGLLLMSLPYGPRAVCQRIRGRVHGVRRVSDGRLYFFQRIYDRRAVEERLIGPISDLAEVCEARTVFRRPGGLAAGYHRLRACLGEDVNGALGVFNPLLSALLNRESPGIVDRDCAYAEVVSLADVYSDMILALRKKPMLQVARG